MGIWVSDGTISLVSNSKTVTGTGTAFKSGANPARVGQQLIVYVGANTATYEIERVDSDSAMQIAMPWRGATINNTPYAINTASEGSPSDLSRRAAQVMGYYQGQLDVIQQLLSGTGIVTATLPDGTELNIPAYSSLPTNDDLKPLATKSELSKKQDVLTITDFGKSLIDDENNVKARTTLGLGNAATRSTTNIDANAPLMEQAFRDLRKVVSYDLPLAFPFGVSSGIQDAAKVGAAGDFVSMLSCIGYSDISGAEAMAQWYASNRQGGIGVRVTYMSGQQAIFRNVAFRTTNNTTVDANGFIKNASPIVRVGALEKINDGDEICGNGVSNFEAKGVSVKRINVGRYVVEGSLGFADDGWYIETPSDANGNKILHVKYQQYDDGVIEIWTSSPDYSSGRCAEGAPVDIPAGRWIDLRLCMDDRDVSLAS